MKSDYHILMINVYCSTVYGVPKYFLDFLRDHQCWIFNIRYSEKFCDHFEHDLIDKGLKTGIQTGNLGLFSEAHPSKINEINFLLKCIFNISDKENEKNRNPSQLGSNCLRSRYTGGHASPKSERQEVLSYLDMYEIRVSIRYLGVY